MSLISIAAASAINSKSRNIRWASEMARGKNGGAENMNLFSSEGLYSNESEAAINAWHNARGPGGIPYVFNPNLWCYSLLPQLTGFVIHKDDCGTGEGGVGAAWRARYGGVAITRRHILYCSHAYSAAAGTWSNGLGITNPTRLRFIDSNGDAVDRVQIHQASAGGITPKTHNGFGLVNNSHAGNGFGAKPVDLCVAVLDEDLPETINIIRQVPANFVLNNSREYCLLTQEWQPQAGGVPSIGDGNYPARNRQMIPIYGGDLNYRPNYKYYVWSGDSGSPVFTVVNGEVLLLGIETSTGGGVYSPYFPLYGETWEQKLNLLIGVADSFAVAMGRMAFSTGYTVSVAP